MEHGTCDLFAVVVIGGSAGGIRAVSAIVSSLPAGFPVPVVVALHQRGGEPPYWPEYLARHSELRVVEAEDKMELAGGTVYCAPADYHLMVEEGGTLALSVDDKVNFARPSIDVLFLSAAEAFGGRTAGVVLTGANEDGAAGLAEIAARGGLALVQDPRTAEWPAMPAAALRRVPRAVVADLHGLARDLVRFCGCD
ncbi:MAG TPA: chemotaxis protein CheB [Verrucomicrobiae bacterium]|nr:chemotaxis protein CheB [Verrucomicrobiae bacterium]